MNELVEVERVDLAGVKVPETLPNSLEQQAQLLFVILSDRPARGTASLSVIGVLAPDAWVIDHKRTVAAKAREQ